MTSSNRPFAPIGMSFISRSDLHARDGGFQRIGAALQPVALLRRHRRLEYLSDAVAIEDARQGQRDAVARLVRADRDDAPLVAQNDFGDARRHDANAMLAGADALDDRDLGKAHLL